MPATRVKSNLTRKSDGNPIPASVFSSQAETEMAALGFSVPSVPTASNHSSANNFGREMRSLLLYSRQRKAERALSPSKSHLSSRQRLIEDGLKFLNKNKERANKNKSRSKSKTKVGNRTEIVKFQFIVLVHEFSRFPLIRMKVYLTLKLNAGTYPSDSRITEQSKTLHRTGLGCDTFSD